MVRHTEKYLKETLFQARRFGLDANHIRQLESELNQRLERNKNLK